MQDILDSLAAVLGPAAPLLSAPPAPQDPKGVLQSCPVLLLLDAQLADLPFEWLPQLKSAIAVVRDFSLHVHYSRMTVAASGRQVMRLVVCRAMSKLIMMSVCPSVSLCLSVRVGACVYCACMHLYVSRCLWVCLLL